MPPEVTVLMPLYNAKDFLSEAIESILNQTFDDFEFLIIDDSNDGSYEIAKKFEAQDNRVRVIRNEPPLGLRKSSNIGIKEAKGTYIARMEADDISMPNRLEEQVHFMKTNPEVDISGCNIKLFGNESGFWTYPQTDDEIKAGLIWGITVAHPTTIMKRDFLINGNHFYVEDGLPYAEDREFFYDMHKQAVFKNMHDTLYYYRRTGGSVTKRMKDKRQQIRKKLLSKIFRDYGVDFNDDEILLHQFILGDFFIEVSKENIIKAKNWCDKLVKHNREKGIYNQEVFQKLTEQRWERLFYFLMNENKKLAKTYFKISEKSYKGHKSYYFKLTLNNFIGRK